MAQILCSQILITAHSLLHIVLLENCKSSTQIWISEQLLLVATGVAQFTFNGAGYASNQSQVIDLNSPDTCTNLQTFPHAIYAGAGGVLNGHPVICGGDIGGKLKEI